MAKIDFDHTKAIDTEAPYPLFVCVCVFFFFCFLLVKNFGKARIQEFSSGLGGGQLKYDFIISTLSISYQSYVHS